MPALIIILALLLYLSYDSLESLGVVDSEVSQHLAVDLDVCLVEFAYELRVAHTLHACSSVDTLNPQRAEVALLLTTVGESIGETLLPSILSYGPHVLAGTKVAAC